MEPVTRFARASVFRGRCRSPYALVSWALALALGAALLVTGSANAAPPKPTATREYDLKAAFLFNFAQFVEWPAEAFADAGTPITIGVLGDDPFGASLDEMVAGETVRNRSLEIRRYHSVDEIGSCHILFISPSEASRLEPIFKALGHRSILTVGDTKDFTSHSGIVGFQMVQRRLRLRINLTAATAARLTISSQLLRQAETVESAGGRN